MKRRVINQKDSFTVTLPKKWAKEKGLKRGDEIDVSEIEGKIVISSESKNAKSEISLDATNEVETTVRSMLANAYRAGYDILKVKFKTKKQLELIKEAVSRNLLGFEILESKENVCIIENIAEPNIDDFNSIFLKILQIVTIHFDSTIEYAKKGVVDEQKNTELTYKAMEYDNFCRRAISKKRFTEKRASFYWAFFSIIIHVVRKIYRFNLDMATLKIKPTKETISILKESKELFNLLKDTYMKKNISAIGDIQSKQKELIYKEGYRLFSKKSKDTVLVYSILDMIRNINLATSPLAGILMD